MWFVPDENSHSETAAPTPLVFCITELDPGGAEQALVQLVRRLDPREWQSTVLCLGPRGRLADQLEEQGISVIALGARHRWEVGVLWRLTRELRRLRPALLQTYLFHANLAGRVAACLAGVPIVVGGIRVAEKRSRWYARLDRWTEKLVTTQVCVSQGVYRFARETMGLRASKLLVIPNGVEVTRFAEATPLPRSTWGLPETSRIVLTVGRLDPQKGLLDLLQAASLLRESAPELHWLIAGEGPQRTQLEQFISQAGLQKCVHLLGRREDVPRLMKSADLFVLASHWEGMPNVVLEAMAARLPVVATQVEGTAELVQPGETGLLVPVGEPRTLSEAIQHLLNDPDQARILAEQAFLQVSQQYDWDRVAEAYSVLYRNLLAGRSREGHQPE